MSHTAPTAGRPRPDDQALRAVEFLLLDVDGVLTDGRVHFDFEGREYKSFHVHDAAGIVYWHRSGGRSGFLSGRGGEIVQRRADELGLPAPLLAQTRTLEALVAAADGLRELPEELRGWRQAAVGDELMASLRRMREET